MGAYENTVYERNARRRRVAFDRGHAGERGQTEGIYDRTQSRVDRPLPKGVLLARGGGKISSVSGGKLFLPHVPR